MIYTILVVLLILALLGAVPFGGMQPGFGLGYYPSGIIGVLLLVLIILALMGRI